MNLSSSAAADLNSYVSVVARYLIIGIGSGLTFLSISSFAEAPELSNLPRTEIGLRSIIGSSEPQRVCSNQNKIRSCWAVSDRISGYEEKVKYSGWSVRCTMAVKVETSARRCWIGGKGLSVSVTWQEAKPRYEVHVRTSRLNSYAPVHVNIDGVVYISPEDSEYGNLELETGDGEKIPAATLVRMIERASEIKTVSWDTNDQENTVEDRSVGFLDAHKFVTGFWDRTN